MSRGTTSPQISSSSALGRSSPDCSGSAAGGLALLHSNGAGRKASGVEVTHLANALANQNGRKPILVWIGTFYEILNSRK